MSSSLNNNFLIQMEFKFDVRRFLRADANGICVLLPQRPFNTREISEIIDIAGRESARAQSLPSTITTSTKFFSSSDNKLYLKIDQQKVVGILKIGIRRLFYSNEIGRIIEISPLCLLDFYIHERYQRSGYGKELYEFMLRTEGVSPNKIAIDRPSSKLVAFMRKHYGLSDFIPQNNNFVVYRQFFSGSPEVSKRQGEEERMNMRPLTQKVEKEGFEHKENYQSRGGIERKSGIALAGEQVVERNKRREENLNGRGEEYRRTYVPAAPWATSARNYAPSTTSSQYGSHSYRK
jgi:GNAT superfamily N-acetyltransferase